MYTIKQAALRAGVSVPLLRAWERRYGIVRPDRTASGYRLYDDAEIERLRAMRGLIEQGWSPSQAARRIESHGVPELPSPGGTVAPSGDDDLTAAFVDAAAALDDQRVEAILDELFAGGSFERVIDDRVMPALRALGDAWAAGTVSVAAEHAASHAVLRRIAAAFEAAARLDAENPILVGLPAGSRHEIGALAFATAARRRGIGVIYLGADVPLESWSHALDAIAASGVVVGIPTAGDAMAARDVVESIAAGRRVLIAVGGPAAPVAALPDPVLRLPDPIAAAASALEAALDGRRT
jgi:DNA-binding transcriptional MerR regulator